VRRRLPIETELIPYEASFPPGQRWLVLAPHPDDELFGMGATLAEAACRGLEVGVVIVTDGAAQGDAAAREEEARCAVTGLGVAPPEFWRFPDRSLSAGNRQLAHALQAALEERKPDAVFVTAPIDLHPDHRALALALQRTLRRRAVRRLRVGPPEWVICYEIALPILPNLLVASPRGWEVKVRAGLAYASQLRFRPYDRLMEAMGTLRALTLADNGRAEAFFVLPASHVVRLTARRWAALMGSPRGVTRRSGG
jgi:LmbE family N-acetylglucosaminyl deacetylase